ncbi:hypothetical protein CcCBS67573_g10671, partial [Chytriomyces confervae]
ASVTTKSSRTFAHRRILGSLTTTTPRTSVRELMLLTRSSSVDFLI